MTLDKYTKDLISNFFDNGMTTKEAPAFLGIKEGNLVKLRPLRECLLINKHTRSIRGPAAPCIPEVMFSLFDALHEVRSIRNSGYIELRTPKTRECLPYAFFVFWLTVSSFHNKRGPISSTGDKIISSKTGRAVKAPGLAPECWLPSSDNLDKNTIMNSIRTVCGGNKK